ncbi:hypothetical protein R3P38DRAFT_3213881 [Favolaschia claudopus]|uniref:Uncharacterized protein n=1 Tax=Favolaschia claudopus TaxID=2862362 RepID=A0AAW0ABE9_9AGAR
MWPFITAQGFTESFHPSIRPEKQRTTRSNSVSWAWDTSFAGFESVKVKNANADSVSRKRHINICIDGRLVLPLVSSDLSPSCAILDDVAGPATSLDIAERVDTTWIFSDSKLTAIKEQLLSRVLENETMYGRAVTPTAQGGGKSAESQGWTL